MYRPSEEFLPSPSPTVPDEPWRKALMDAAEVLRRGGWCQGELHNKFGAHCALGAIDAASRGSISAGLDPTNAFKRHLGIRHLAPWNDHPSRTAAEVISALEAAARS